MRDEVAAARRWRWCRSTASTSTCRPASSGSPWPRSASGSWASRPSRSLIEKLIGDSISHGISLAISLAIAYLITTALHITLGEQVPKIYAIVHAEGTALRVARPLQYFRTAFNPLIQLLNWASNAVLRLLGVDSRAEFEGRSSEDLKLLIAQSAHEGKIDAGEAGCSRVSSISTSSRRVR